MCSSGRATTVAGTGMGSGGCCWRCGLRRLPQAWRPRLRHSGGQALRQPWRSGPLWPCAAAGVPVAMGVGVDGAACRMRMGRRPRAPRNPDVTLRHLLVTPYTNPIRNTSDQINPVPTNWRYTPEIIFPGPKFVNYCLMGQTNQSNQSIYEKYLTGTWLRAFCLWRLAHGPQLFRIISR